jgi:MoaA/NifB/PqqE/SkfB family radical SAM enzyme
MGVLTRAGKLARPKYLRALRPLGSNLVSLLLDRRDASAPFYASWLLTYRCNLHCAHCDQVWKMTGGALVSSKASPIPLRRELSSDQKVLIADQIARSRTWGVTLSGGEPLVEPACLEIIRRLKARRKYINICTNGLLLPRYAEQLIDLGVDSITVSLDSHLPELHDSIRAREGAFAGVFAGIEAIRRARKGADPSLGFKSVITPANVRHLSDYVRYCRPFVDSVSFQPVQENTSMQVRDKDLLFRPEHEQTFRDSIAGLIARWPEFDRPYYRRMADFVFHPGRLFGDAGHRNLFYSACFFGIDPFGDVGPYVEHEAIGNLMERSYEELWQSRENLAFQRKLRTGEVPCVMWTYNSVVNSYLLAIYDRLRWR